MYSNYGITTFNSKIKLKNINKLLIKAYDREQEEGLFEMWKLQFPNMDKDTFISFEDYKEKNMTNANYTEITLEEIEKEMEQVEKAFIAKALTNAERSEGNGII